MVTQRRDPVFKTYCFIFFANTHTDTHKHTHTLNTLSITTEHIQLCKILKNNVLRPETLSSSPGITQNTCNDLCLGSTQTPLAVSAQLAIIN